MNDRTDSNPTTLNTATFATLDKFVESLPPSEKISKDKAYSLARQGKLTLYKLPDVKPVCVKIDEARAVLAKLSAQGKIRRGYGSFGPDAVVRDMSKVAGQTFRVDQ